MERDKMIRMNKNEGKCKENEKWLQTSRTNSCRIAQCFSDPFGLLLLLLLRQNIYETLITVEQSDTAL